MSAAAGNRAVAQDSDTMLPDAADGWDEIEPTSPPPLRFTDEKGGKMSLGAYKGHILVVNLWATWCGPCTDELPTLAALAVRIRAFGGLVLPISIDGGGGDTVRPFYTTHNILDLPILLDPDGDNLDILNTNGVPVTLVINPAAQLVARLDGAANWNTPDVLQFLQALAPTQPKTPAAAKI